MNNFLDNYEDALAFLNSHDSLERKETTGKNERFLKLERILALLNELGNPENSFKSIHIAGTVGKGSTAVMLSSMLRGLGLKVGLFTSPHLVDIRERITINDSYIPKHAFVSIMNELKKAGEKCENGITFFELLTALAALHFRNEKVDMAVVETGLGGKLDSTNVIRPLVSIITTIDFDHEHILGNTLSQIAAEKAGIFKAGVPAIVLKQNEEITKTFKESAKLVGARLKIVGDDCPFSFSKKTAGEEEEYFLNLNAVRKFKSVRVPLKGVHQVSNCALALTAMDELFAAGLLHFNEARLREGLASARHPGRLEKISRQGRAALLMDGAHNPASMDALLCWLDTASVRLPLACVFGCNRTKNYASMLLKLEPYIKEIIFTRVRDNPRALDPALLLEEFKSISSKPSRVMPDLPAALEALDSNYAEDEIFLLTGSLYLVGEAKGLLQCQSGEL